MSRAVAETVLHVYAAASGNSFGDHRNQEAAIQWMQCALSKAGITPLIEAADAFINYDAQANDDVPLIDNDEVWDALSAALAACKGELK